MVSVGAVLFAGGKSRRMGTDKASLTLHGDTFLQRIAGELSPFPEKPLSVDDPDRYPQLPWLHVTDEKPGCGPLGGLCAVLRACRSEALLVVSCDLPLYERRLGDYLCGQLQEPFDAVVSTTPDGTHPLCAVYRKRCLPIFETHLASGDYRIRFALQDLRVRYADVGDMAPMLQNINTPQEYHDLLVHSPR